MYSLYIDTHGNYVTIVVFKSGRVIIEKKKEASFNHSTNTMPMIEDVLNTNNIKVNDLKEIIVVNGPGSFTGVRIGVTIAKTFAYALNIPIKTISSLLIKAISVDTNSDKTSLIKDKNGQYVGVFDKDNKEIIEYKYYKNEEYKTNKENIIDDIEIDYEKVYEYLKEVKPMNPHEVKPIYVKNVEV